VEVVAGYCFFDPFDAVVLKHPQVVTRDASGGVRGDDDKNSAIPHPAACFIATFP
jgi:hypothetical protein